MSAAMNSIEPNRTDMGNFLDMVFGYVEPGDENHAYAIALRGIGEKGTSGEGGFIEPQIIPPLRGNLEADLIFGHIQRWSAHHRASFILPAAVAPSALSDNKATEDRILQITTMCVDLDSGETEKAMAHACKYLGQATMVVRSGGTTAEGHPKLHVYWRFTEPSSFVSRIAAARKQLALKLGGDAAFGRSTQVIRIPGSIYSKNGVEKPCWICERSHGEYEMGDVLSQIADMPVLAGIQVDTSKLIVATPKIYAMGGGLNFTAYKEAKMDLADDKPDIGQSLTTDIHEGGDVDRNRWGEFGRITGLYIKQARDGLIKMDDARGMSHAWMALHMKPTWPPQKFESEFKRLTEVDARNHGPIIEGNVVDFSKAKSNNPNLSPPETVVEQLDGTLAVPSKLNDFDVGAWRDDDVPTRHFLVSGLIQAGKSCLLAAEGGAGKTFLLLELATKVAMHDPGALQSWCGQPLGTDAGGTVVMFTTEDDRDELKIRLSEILTKEQRAILRERKTLKLVPTINAGGAFPLVERKRAQGPARTGERWQAFLEEMKLIDNLKLVIIDTLNSTMHGEENSATVINEYVQAAGSVICGEKNAALIVTHHIRKPSANIKIYTPEDMKAAIRGSSAIIGAFRCVIGIWAAPDFKSRLSGMALPPKRGQLYNLAVLKANNPEMDYSTRALLRQKSGLLSDITEREQNLIASAKSEQSAWMVKAAEYAADMGHPFSIKAAMKRPPNGRRHQLPPALQDLTEREVQIVCERLIEDGRLVQCNPAGQTRYNYLDVPDGPLAKADAAVDGTLYKVSAGKDFEPPDWMAIYAYHAVEGRIVGRGKETERTIRPVRQTAAQPRPKGSFNPNQNAKESVPPTLTTDTSNSNAAPETEVQATLTTLTTQLRFSPDCSHEPKT